MQNEMVPLEITYYELLGEIVSELQPKYVEYAGNIYVWDEDNYVMADGSPESWDKKFLSNEFAESSINSPVNRKIRILDYRMAYKEDGQTDD